METCDEPVLRNNAPPRGGALVVAAVISTLDHVKPSTADELVEEFCTPVLPVVYSATCPPAVSPATYNTPFKTPAVRGPDTVGPPVALVRSCSAHAFVCVAT